jgi:hypothetical protein
VTHRRVISAIAGAALLAVSPQAVRLTPEYRASMRWAHRSMPICAWCGTTNRIAIHHIASVQSRPWLAACRTNLIALCDPPRRRDGDHWLRGHMGRSWMMSNPNVEDACHAQMWNKHGHHD